MTASCRWKPQTRTAPPSTARSATMRLSPQMCPLPLTGMVSAATAGLSAGLAVPGAQADHLVGRGLQREILFSSLRMEESSH